MSVPVGQGVHTLGSAFWACSELQANFGMAPNVIRKRFFPINLHTEKLGDRNLLEDNDGSVPANACSVERHCTSPFKAQYIDEHRNSAPRPVCVSTLSGRELNT